jgi:hypothetical protein
MTELEWQGEAQAIRDDLAWLNGRPHEPQAMRQASPRGQRARLTPRS